MRKITKLSAFLLALFTVFSLSLTLCSCNEIANEIGAEIGDEIDKLIAGEVESYISKGIAQYENIYVDAEQPDDESSQQTADNDSQTQEKLPSDEETKPDETLDTEEVVTTDEASDETSAEEAFDEESEGAKETETIEVTDAEAENLPDENGSYTTKDDVALFIHTYGKLPSNFITKNEARKLGWQGGGLEEYAPGKCIGGDRFGNYEGMLPEKSGRKYTECDIDTLGKNSRGAKRIVFSNDGLIYYTDDHYDSFTLLYGKE